jgi:hypothetical protein
MSIDKLGLNTIGTLDQYLGIIPSISAFNMILEKETLLMKSYIYNLKRLVVMEKIFFDKKIKNDVIKICSDKTAEYNLFGQIILEHTFENKLEEILCGLEQEQFILGVNVDDNGCFDVKKNPQIQNLKFLDDIVNPIHSEHDFNRSLFLEHAVPQKSLDNLFEKMTITVELLKELQNKNLMNNLNKELLSVGCTYKNKLNIPMVGSIKGRPDSIIIYILSYFESEQQFSEFQNVNLQMNTMFEFLLKINNVKNLVKKTAHLGGIIDNCFIRKMITVPESDKSLCVIHCIVFKNDLFLNDSTDFMINLKKDIEQNLKWNTFFNIGEFVTLPLG